MLRNFFKRVSMKTCATNVEKAFFFFLSIFLNYTALRALTPRRINFRDGCKEQNYNKIFKKYISIDETKNDFLSW